MLTTIDNPFNPFTQFDAWYEFDIEHQYLTCEWLDRFLKTSSVFDEETINEDVDNAIDDFLAFNPYGRHMKVYEDEADRLIPLANAAFNNGLNA